MQTKNFTAKVASRQFFSFTSATFSRPATYISPQRLLQSFTGSSLLSGHHIQWTSYSSTIIFPGSSPTLLVISWQRAGIAYSQFQERRHRGCPAWVQLRYRVSVAPPEGIHAFAARFDSESRRAEGVLRAALALRERGANPALIYVHPGWGKTSPCEMSFHSPGSSSFVSSFIARQVPMSALIPNFLQMTLVVRSGFAPRMPRNSSRLLTRMQRSRRHRGNKACILKPSLIGYPSFTTELIPRPSPRVHQSGSACQGEM